jgi:DNA-binding CsgD family transcriptional regulator
LCWPEASFDYAECVLFCCREAARRILNPLYSGYRRVLLAAVIRHHVQFAGIFYEHLRYRVKKHLIEQGLTEWPECEGLSPLGYGPKHIGRAEIEANRRALLGVIAETSRWYERTLAMIETHPNADKRACGHELHHWIGGAKMPAALSVPVLVEPDGDALLIAPDKDDAFPLVQAGWDLPEYAVDAHMVTSDPKPNLPVIEPVVFVEARSPPAAQPSDAEIAAARVLQSGLVVSTGPLLETLTPSERELANLLLSYRDPERRTPYSYREIGRMLKCSGETVRRRRKALEKKCPAIRSLIAVARARNGKGGAPEVDVTRGTIEFEDE